MKPKIYIYLIINLLSYSLTVKSQNTLTLKSFSGLSSSFTLNQIKSIKFDNTYLILTEKNSNTNPFPLQEIRYINFADKVNTAVETNKVGVFSVFPNPVVDKLIIRFNHSIHINVLIKLIDMQGRILKVKEIRVHSEKYD